MFRIGIVGCGLQAATIASYVSVYGDDYQVVAVMDNNIPGAKARMAEKSVRIAPDCCYTENIEDFLANPPAMDGIIIGTYCAFHTEMACKLEKLGVPIYMEKPVAITLEQVHTLYNAFKDSKTPIQVSLPMRLCPLAQKAKAFIDAGEIGQICQVVGYEDTDGEVYFTTWFRDAEKTGGMFMQKAVHDIDYMLYLAGVTPAEVCAMRAKVWYKGDKAYDQTCDSCPDKNTCDHGPYKAFDVKGIRENVPECEKYLSGIYTPDGTFLRKRVCAISKDIAIEDIGECIIRCTNGIHICHTQNFIASRSASRRGARFVGSKGSLEIDFNHSKISIYSSVDGCKGEFTVDNGRLSHYGGDRQLIKNFINTMKTGERATTDLIHGDGIMSTLTCLSAKESADTGKFIQISL